MTQTDGPGDPQPHYWSMDHYGFDDHPPVAPQAPLGGQPAGRPAAQQRRGVRLLLAAGVATTALVLAGTAGIAAAQAVGEPPDRADAVQQDGVPVVDLGDGVGRGRGPGGPGGFDGGPRGGGR